MLDRRMHKALESLALQNILATPSNNKIVEDLIISPTSIPHLVACEPFFLYTSLSESPAFRNTSQSSGLLEFARAPPLGGD